MKHEKPIKTCTFKDLIFEDNIVKCRICGDLKKEEITEEPPRVEWDEEKCN